jgi:hypothetical protein
MPASGSCIRATGSQLKNMKRTNPACLTMGDVMDPVLSRHTNAAEQQDSADGAKLVDFH